jgi:uncharacterized protein
MTYIIIAIVAGLGSLLTFYAGFGLGTLLTPVFMLFFPVEVAIAMTGIVHFATNIFKFGLTYKHVNWEIAIRFGIPAIIASFVGAWVLGYLSSDHVAYTVQFNNTVRSVTLLKLVLALLMLVFVLLEWIPRFRDASFAPDKMVYGGLLSGFFGGLAGFQGVLRSMFLIKSDLSKEAYIATGIIIACCIDITRLGRYFNDVDLAQLWAQKSLLMIAVLAATLGAFLGNLWLKKITIARVQQIVSVILIVFAICLLAGLI